MTPCDVLMVIADADVLHHARPLRPNDVVAMVTLPDHARSGDPDNTIMVDLGRLGMTHVEVTTIDGHHRRVAPIEGIRLLHDLQPGDILNDLFDALAGPGRADEDYAAVFCALPQPGGLHIYSRAHQRSGRICFIRTSPKVVPLTSDDLGWVEQAIALHASHAAELNSHHCMVPLALAGNEVETKFTLPADTAIWPLATSMYTRMAAGDIPNMVRRFEEDFEMREFDNHLFDVTAPTEDCGYVAFMEVQPCTYRIKRKRFTADALIRSETVGGEMRPGMPLPRYVKDVLGLSAESLPAFRRVRYDIMFESLATGNHYCILFDRSVVRDAPTEKLVQCEIEYMCSRRILPLDDTAVLAEFAQLTSWCGSFLHDRGLPAEPGYYSKLSFLRDVVQRQPQLSLRE